MSSQPRSIEGQRLCLAALTSMSPGRNPRSVGLDDEDDLTRVLGQPDPSVALPQWKD